MQRIGRIYNSITITNINNSEQEKENTSDIVIHDISEAIVDQNILTFITRDNKGKIQYIRPARVKDKLNYRIIKSDEYFNDYPDEEKLRHIEFSYKFYGYYLLISLLFPFLYAIIGHASEETQNEEGEEGGKERGEGKENVTNAITFYCIYFFFGVWFKGCVNDINDNTHTQRTCTKKTMLAGLICKLIGNLFLAY